MSLRYLLDTNAASAAMNDPEGPVGTRLAVADRESVAMSIVVAGELLFGLAKNPSPRLLERLDGFFRRCRVVEIEPPTHVFYAEVRADLERRGLPIGANDMWIAAHTLALDLTLVTDNVSEFARVEGLRVENWLRP